MRCVLTKIEVLIEVCVCVSSANDRTSVGLVAT